MSQAPPRRAGDPWRARLWARATSIGALGLGVVATTLALVSDVWVATPLVTATLMGLVIGSLVAMPAAALLAAIALLGRTVPRRAVGERVASVLSVAVFAYLAAWILRHDAAGGMVRATLTAALGIAYVEALRRLLRGRLDAGLLADRRARRSGRTAVAMAALAVGAGAALAVGAAWGPAGGRARLVERPPATRVLLVQVDGVARDHFTYWSALRPRAALGEIVLNGASAHVAWPVVTEPRASLAQLGDPGAAGTPTERGLPGVRAIVRAALLLPPPPVPASDRATPWQLARELGLGTLLVGWARSDPGVAGDGPVIAPGDHDRLQRLLEGETGALDGVPQADGLRPLRELARPPLDDWRRGARLDERERRLVTSASAMGVRVEDYWRDRFLVRAFRHRLEEGETALNLLRLGFGRTLTEGFDTGDPDAPLDLRDATVAYLDALDAEVLDLRRVLRAGDVLIVLVTPAESGTRVRPAPIVFFGEKVAASTSSAEALEVEDVSVTVRYLLGVTLPPAATGRVAWPLLAPGLAERLPPERTGGAAWP